MSSTMRQAGLIQHGALTMTMIGAIPTGLSRAFYPKIHYTE